MLDSSTRQEHADWHGTILPVDHPFWQTHYPPNGWYCRCQVIQLSDADLARRGLAVTEAPEVKMVAKEIKGRGRIETPEGIDPGFGHNAGIAAGVEPELTAMERHGPWEALQPGASAPGAGTDKLPALEPLAQPVREAGDDEGVRTLLRDVLGGNDRVFTDPMGVAVKMTLALAEHLITDPTRKASWRERFFPLLPELVEHPQEIWVGFARSTVTGRVALRRRYIRVVKLDKTRVLGLVADWDNLVWSGVTFLFGRPRGGVDALRGGIRVYPR